MIDLSYLRGVPVAVMGLGKSGLAAARTLARSGVDVRAWDDGEARRHVAAAEAIPLVNLHEADFSGVALLLLSPGIPHTYPAPHPVVARAKAANVPVMGDIELLFRAYPNAHYIGITGTNGKSTTTSLVAHILHEVGISHAVGGNLGMPALTLLPVGPDGAFVLEVSSYQLELCPTAVFGTAALLNITPDHLERHGGMEGYIAAKKLIFRGNREKAVAVVGMDDEYCRAIAAELQKEGHAVIPISAEGPVAGGVYVENGILVDNMAGKAVPVLDLRTARALPGQHNWQNAAVAFAVARANNIAVNFVVAALKSFPGLPHRQQLVAEIGGVRYINDSKATNAAATAKALACYDNIYLIAGGRAKEGGLAGLEAFMGRVRHAFLIGEAAQDFGAWLEGRAAHTQCGDLRTAVHQAHEMAQAAGGDAVVLLSPACASFDQFVSFEERGAMFTALVEALVHERKEAP